MLDLEKMRGWQTLEAAIHAEIEQNVQNLRRIVIDGRSLQEIGAEYISIIQNINGLSKTLELKDEIRNLGEQAEE